MKGRMVLCWHPESPGLRVTVWRPWWRRKARPFATLSEVLRASRPTFHAIGPTLDDIVFLDVVYTSSNSPTTDVTVWWTGPCGATHVETNPTRVGHCPDELGPEWAQDEEKS